MALEWERHAHQEQHSQPRSPTANRRYIQALMHTFLSLAICHTSLFQVTHVLIRQTAVGCTLARGVDTSVGLGPQTHMSGVTGSFLLLGAGTPFGDEPACSRTRTICRAQEMSLKCTCLALKCTVIAHAAVTQAVCQMHLPAVHACRFTVDHTAGHEP